MKGWLDNFGKADNASDSKVSMSEDFVGLGYDTKGRNYSPAWGGQFAMGGSIPGSVGFTYARVAGAAPSKGKYAKKTMASAQNGIIADKIAGLELQQNPEYQRLKYLQSLPQLRQSPGLLEKILGPADSDLVKAADIATDIMQLGNFIPHPIAQGIGKIGNVAGTAIDSYQAAASFYKGDNVGGVVNAASAVLPSFLGASTFRRPAMNLRPGDPLYSLTEQATKPYALNLAKPSTDYLELFSKVKKMKDNSLLYNRALLGFLGGEMAYDALAQPSSPNVINSSDIEGVYPNFNIELENPKSQPLPTKTESSDPAIAKKLADYMKSKSKEKTGEVYGRKSYYPIDEFQNGGEMRFYQNGLDWKPKSMQDGGKIYEGQELPEFVVEGKDDRLKQAMYEGSNRFLQGLVGVMGSPQTGLMEVITGKQQTPSQAFGFQDTGGWLDSPKSFGKNLSNLAMDVVLDPINLLGVGIADDIARTTVKGLSKKAASKELPSKVGKITGLRAGVTAGDVNDLVDKNINYIESDEYLQRRMATTGESKEQVLKDVSKYKDRLKNTTINLSASGEGGLMDPLNIPYLTNKKIKVGKGITDKEEVLGVLDHEIKHMLSPASEFPLFSPNTTSGDRLGKYFNYPELEINSPVGKYDYFRDPMEQQVRMLKLNEKIRQDLGIKDIRKITEKEFDSWKSKHLDETLNNPRYRDFKQIYEDATDKGRSDLLNTLNRLWAAPAIGVVSAQAIEQKKDGGFVKQFQDGGTEKISINDPRYPELHKNRQVGAYYDGAFTLPDLPEVTVTAPRSYTMDSLRDFTTAALYGAPANAMKLSMIPQAAMTEGIEALRGEPYDFSNVNPNFGGFTSNQRDLSQTMGYENPEGFLQNAVNFGLSAIDPMILSGASKVVGKQLARKAVPEFIPEKIVFDLMDESIDPFAQVLKNVKIHDTPSPFAKDVQREAFKYQKLARDPRYLERVKNIDRDFGSRLEPLLNQFKNDEIENVNQYFPFNISIVDEIPYSFGGESVDVLGISSLNTEGSLKNAMNKGVKYPQKITPSTDRHIEINEPRHLRENTPARGTVHHELKHHWTNALLDAENENYERALKNLIARRSEAGIDPRDVAANQDYNYLSRGTEVDAHLMTNLRDEMVNRGYLKDHFDELSESRLNDFLSKEKDYRGVREYFNPLKPMVTDKSKFVDFFNKYGLPSTVIGGVLGGQAIDQQRNGGITKDNQGYWNPDNWGKPVEIDSNEITMEGVYEPLLGVSDTGDTKLMKPGKNYKFKGKKVTEFPVAKLGINQLDAQPMKKLNQLLNFTNNPDKDNWLDKYN